MTMGKLDDDLMSFRGFASIACMRDWLYWTSAQQLHQIFVSATDRDAGVNLVETARPSKNEWSRTGGACGLSSLYA